MHKPLNFTSFIAVLMLVVVPVRSIYAQSDSTSASISYCNPFDIQIADPHVVRAGNTCYLYGTNATTTGFIVYKSSDLVNWTEGPQCYTKTETSWGQRHFWAPEVYNFDGTWYLFYTAQHQRNADRNICVATSTSPEGPFKDVRAPLIPDGSYIDFHAYRHKPTGELYGYFVGEGRTKPGIYVAKLNSTFTDLATTPVICLQESQPWETNWVEGPFIVPHNGLLYMMYSGSAYWRAGYNVGYAVADHPLGPWRKFDGNPILRNTPDVSGPGHNCVYTEDGNHYVFYHRHLQPDDKQRVLALDRLIFTPDPAGGPDRMVMPEAPSITTQTLSRRN